MTGIGEWRGATRAGDSVLYFKIAKCEMKMLLVLSSRYSPVGSRISVARHYFLDRHTAHWRDAVARAAACVSDQLFKGDYNAKDSYDRSRRVADCRVDGSDRRGSRAPRPQIGWRARACDRAVPQRE